MTKKITPLLMTYKMYIHNISTSLFWFVCDEKFILLSTIIRITCRLCNQVIKFINHYSRNIFYKYVATALACFVYGIFEILLVKTFSAVSVIVFLIPSRFPASSSTI